MNDSIRTQVVLLHSNDVHSRLENAAKIAGYISEERRTHGSDSVLVIDCGDHIDRMRVETEGSDGLVNVALLNQAGYEAVTLGNNEGLTYSVQVLEDLYRNHAAFPVICSNMKEASTGELPGWLLPHAVIEKNGLSIGLIGVTTAYTDFYSLLGWEATDPMEAVREQAVLLREQVQVVVVLSHLGIKFDMEMAESIDGIDLIIGAHTHHLLEEPIVIGGTTICAAGKFGEYIGRVEIGMDELTRRPVFRASVAPTAAFEEHPEATRIISEFLETGRQRLNEVVAVLDEPLPSSTDRESPLCNLLAAGLRRWTDAEIGLVNTGQLLGGLAQGEVTAGQLHALCPSPINPCKVSIEGKYLREALEQSLLQEYIDKPIKGYGFRGHVLGNIAVDGMRIVYDSKRPDYEKLRTVLVNGKPLDDHRLYLVGMIDMFTFKAGYESLANGRSTDFYLPEFIRDLIAVQLQDSAYIADCRRRRWHNLSVDAMPAHL
ncbi:bifunctional metallophosphatase/5'-nucleotidase [Paenibacillus harenae]|uniref:2',3'-cyclic-nucleotide 2'-phosphodiesterase (5'-nucleotidase family) n=1 Tax=Paenibacillus harenae TaxID=306543 RepID=A0ABT9U7J0_PAEHA|nr:bifunctional UDP-sugar hydrolase/5'-nucleotidase [Paenibacillus harenae]MDQ0114419.1 2',3'-cyclic-nucleotide 2'-phosphodiesterase (5'-nucleotidase family) [Paenibacillus harenae]